MAKAERPVMRVLRFLLKKNVNKVSKTLAE